MATAPTGLAARAPSDSRALDIAVELLRGTEHGGYDAETITEMWLHSDRAARGDRFHRHSRLDPLPVLCPGALQGAAGLLSLLHQAVGHRHDDVRAGLRRALPQILPLHQRLQSERQLQPSDWLAHRRLLLA